MATVVYTVGHDVSTDVIYPGRYMATVLPAETPQFAFADDAAFNEQLGAKAIQPGSVVIAGKNFGCGSSSRTRSTWGLGWSPVPPLRCRWETSGRSTPRIIDAGGLIPYTRQRLVAAK
ncbi:MAG: hypothetical protein HYV20_10300 [Gemmatimonadetes bacterium]|nr:hypothetical protein [Gemmatimonadota bacterium]